jgi:hypothetical protein
MGSIVAGMGSSHAFAFLQPEQWDARRQITRNRYTQRYGTELPEQPGVERETLEANQERFGRTIAAGLSTLREKVAALRPDALILIGDDQDENYTVANLPQFAIYTGPEVTALDGATSPRRTLRCHQELSRDILEGMVEQGFDLAYSETFPNNELRAHAHGPALRIVDPNAEIPCVLIFVNAIHVPGPTPARCYQFGQALREVIEARPGDERVVLYASGGLSHFTAGFPWPHYSGPETVGAICEDFDRQAVEYMRQGRGQELAKLTSRDLLNSGNIEMRQWIVLQGALGDTKPQLLTYEPFYRGLIGMCVGYWEPAPARAAVGAR